MYYNLMGNRQTTINSVRNLQRKYDRQHRRMVMLDIWSQVCGPRSEYAVNQS